MILVVVSDDRFFPIWLAMAGLMLLPVLAALVWALKTHQFSGQDRARYLPLEAGRLAACDRPDGSGEPKDASERKDAGRAGQAAPGGGEGGGHV